MNLSKLRKTMANHLRQEPTAAPELTEDLLLEIAKRLPLKNALQWSSISKSFNSYITSPTFAREHALLSSSSPSGRTIIFNCSANEPMIYTTLVSTAESESIDMQNKVSILASCNGVLLLRLQSYINHQLHYVVFNPITGGNLFIDYPVYHHEDAGLAVDFPKNSPSTFKLVMIDNIEIWSTNQTVLRFTVVAPSAADGKTVAIKSKVDFLCKDTPFKYLSDDPNIRPVYAHGRLHWLRDDAAKIVAFDVEKEQATIIAGPINNPGFQGFIKWVDKWFGFAQESLHFIYALPEHIIVHTHDYGNDKWRLAHRIKNISERPKNNVLRYGLPVMFDGDHVFFHLRAMEEGGHVWMYDLKSGNWKKSNGKVREWADWKQNFFAYLPTMANLSYGEDQQKLLQYSEFNDTLLSMQELLR